MSPAGPDGLVIGKVGRHLMLEEGVAAAHRSASTCSPRSAVGVAELPFDIAVEVELAAEAD